MILFIVCFTTAVVSACALIGIPAMVMDIGWYSTKRELKDLFRIGKRSLNDRIHKSGIRNFGTYTVTFDNKDMVVEMGRAELYEEDFIKDKKFMKKFEADFKMFKKEAKAFKKSQLKEFYE